ncbi:MAG: YidC/Oxa1 family insertase periplasmic-domain containing protein [Pirellulales bacterium]|nr:YidC/Oxa1 family insertase periplasmic-domain containing protein [Pirellulales bacterium]
MEKRFFAWLVLSLLLFFGYMQLMRWWNPPPPRAPLAQAEAATNDGAKNEPAAAPDGAADAAQPANPETPASGAAEQPAPPDAPPAEPAAEAPAAAPVPLARGTLGSLDPASGARLLVTWVNRGAAIERIELNVSQYLDQEDRGGYLGHLDAVDNTAGGGALVQVVGPGTPAALAGLKAGDVIVGVDNKRIEIADDLEVAIHATKPQQEIALKVMRGEAQQTLTTKLIRRPLEVIRPANLAEVEALWERVSPDVVEARGNTPSLLLTLEQLDDKRLEGEVEELTGVALRGANWEVVDANDREVAFRKRVDPAGIEIIKRFRLARPAGEQKGAAARDYHLEFEIEIHNRSAAPHPVAYRLFGPNGLPTEGWWYASKISRNWGGAGPRDVVFGNQFEGKVTDGLVTCASLAGGKPAEIHRGIPLAYAGVDTQYFAAVLLPQKDEALDDWFYEWQPLVVPPAPQQKDKLRLANTSLRLTSQKRTLAPGDSLIHRYVLFAGPKKPAILDQYALGELNYYGWFGWVARPLASVLHFFARLPGVNFGLAIILLTVLVRGSMFPLGRKQAAAAAKMQLLQPEMKRLNEKYKTDMEARAKAQRELFAKHGYNPLSGCLPLVIQMPIFIGLYRSLSVDLELRGAALLWDGAWASNLAAPDKMFHWLAFMPQFVLGWLGPYFNLLPLITIALFIVQQKMFMPPPTDEQAAMQQKMMQYMMIFMGVMFFKVPSGLCVYFIASSLWGLAERKLVPKPGTTPPAAPPPGENRLKSALASVVAAASNGQNGSGSASSSKKKPRGKRFAPLVDRVKSSAWWRRVVQLVAAAERRESRRPD